MAAVAPPAHPAAVAVSGKSPFSALPNKILGLIVKASMSGPQGNITEIKFDRTLNLRRKAPGKKWEANWAYTLRERNATVIQHVNQATRAAYLQQRPHILQVNRQLLIHFNGDQDTIYIDCESMFNLFHYVEVWRVDYKIPHRNLLSFLRIRALGHFNSVLPPVEIIDNDGLASLMQPRKSIVRGLTSIRLLDPRGYHPGPRQMASTLVQ